MRQDPSLEPLRAQLAAAAVGGIHELREMFKNAYPIIGTRTAKTGKKAAILTFQGVKAGQRVKLVVGWHGCRAEYWLKGRGNIALADELRDNPRQLEIIKDARSCQ